MFTPRWSGEVGVSHRSSRAIGTFYDPNGNVIDTIEFRAHTTPVDVVGQYHWVNTTAWKPYIGAGFTHVFVNSSNFRQSDQNFFAANGGVVWRGTLYPLKDLRKGLV